jgi:hypothetical protein
MQWPGVHPQLGGLQQHVGPSMQGGAAPGTGQPSLMELANAMNQQALASQQNQQAGLAYANSPLAPAYGSSNGTGSMQPMQPFPVPGQLQQYGYHSPALAPTGLGPSNLGWPPSNMAALSSPAYAVGPGAAAHLPAKKDARSKDSVKKAGLKQRLNKMFGGKWVVHGLQLISMRCSYNSSSTALYMRAFHCLGFHMYMSMRSVLCWDG